MKKTLLLIATCAALLASEVSTGFFAYRADTQAVTSSTTLVDDNTLTKALAAGGVYQFEFIVPFNLAGVLSGYKFAVNGPTSPTAVSYKVTVENLSGAVVIPGTVVTTLDTALAGALAASGDHMCTVRGIIENGSNAGNLVFRFAQNTSDGSAITISRGARMQVWRIK